MTTACNTKKSCPGGHERHGPANKKPLAKSLPAVLGPGVWEALFSVYLDQGDLGASLGPRVAPESAAFIIPTKTHPGSV